MIEENKHLDEYAFFNLMLDEIKIGLSLCKERCLIDENKKYINDYNVLAKEVFNLQVCDREFVMSKEDEKIWDNSYECFLKTVFKEYGGFKKLEKLKKEIDELFLKLCENYVSRNSFKKFFKEREVVCDDGRKIVKRENWIEGEVIYNLKMKLIYLKNKWVDYDNNLKRMDIEDIMWFHNVFVKTKLKDYEILKDKYVSEIMGVADERGMVDSEKRTVMRELNKILVGYEKSVKYKKILIKDKKEFNENYDD